MNKKGFSWLLVGVLVVAAVISLVLVLGGAKPTGASSADVRQDDANSQGGVTHRTNLPGGPVQGPVDPGFTTCTLNNGVVVTVDCDAVPGIEANAGTCDPCGAECAGEFESCNELPCCAGFTCIEGQCF